MTGEANSALRCMQCSPGLGHPQSGSFSSSTLCKSPRTQGRKMLKQSNIACKDLPVSLCCTQTHTETLSAYVLRVSFWVELSMAHLKVEFSSLNTKIQATQVFEKWESQRTSTTPSHREDSSETLVPWLSIRSSLDFWILHKKVVVQWWRWDYDCQLQMLGAAASAPGR